NRGEIDRHLMVIAGGYAMARNLSLRLVLGSIVGVLAALLIGVATYNAVTAFAERQVARAIASGNETSDLFLLAAGNLAAERGLTKAALKASDAISQESRGAIQQRRERGDRAIETAISVLRMRNDVKALVADVEAAHTRVQELRRAADTAFAQPRAGRDKT